MQPPISSIDSRFSDPGTHPTSWNEALRALETAELFWIATVRADGRPQVSPLVAIWLDGALHFATGADEQKAVNLRHDPHVVLTTGCNEWDGGLDLVIEGDAARITDNAMLEQLAGAWRRKWDGRWRFEAREGAFHHEAGSALVFAVRPSKVLAFGKGVFTQTRYRF